MRQALAERDSAVFMWGGLRSTSLSMFRALADDPAYRAVREESGIATFLQERAARASASTTPTP